MNTQQKSKGASQATAMLIVDFSNGIQKIFANLPCEPAQDFHPDRRGMSVIDLLDQAKAKRPSLSYRFRVFDQWQVASNRAGWKAGAIVEVDGVTVEGSNQRWQVWVNEKLLRELWMLTPESVTMFEDVRPGDVVLLKLVTEA